jgi:hypothetical protein
VNHSSGTHNLPNNKSIVLRYLISSKSLRETTNPSLTKPKKNPPSWRIERFINERKELKIIETSVSIFGSVQLDNVHENSCKDDSGCAVKAGYFWWIGEGRKVVAGGYLYLPSEAIKKMSAETLFIFNDQ